MDVFEFIKEKKAGLKDNTEQYRLMLEPKLKSLSEKINNSIKDTLNNPWVSSIKAIDRSYYFGQKRTIPNPMIRQVNDKITDILGKEIYIGQW